MAFSPNDRFQLYRTPPMPPGQCFVCNSSSGGPFVDLGINIDNFERLVAYICVRCLHDIVDNIDDFHEPRVVKESNEEGFNRGIRAAYGTLKEDIDGYISRLIDSRIVDDPSVTFDTSGSESESVSLDPVRQEGDGISSGGVDVESDSVDFGEGPFSVPSDSSDGSNDDSGFDPFRV